MPKHVGDFYVLYHEVHVLGIILIVEMCAVWVTK